jgi:hypothetical protein
MIEEWKDIPGYEGSYQVSNFGNVKSLDFNRSGKERLLKPGVNKNGYKFVVLFFDKKSKNYYIHQLVAMAFYDHIPDGFKLVVNHKDNNQLNNHKDNLEIVTNRYNTQVHKKDVGISYNKPIKKFQSRIRINGKLISLGYFGDKEKALQIYQRALENVHLYDGDYSKFRELINS